MESENLSIGNNKAMKIALFNINYNLRLKISLNNTHRKEGKGLW